MQFLNKLSHEVIDKLSLKDYNSFVKNRLHLEEEQRFILKSITKELYPFHPTVKDEMIYEELVKLPITNYSDWDSFIEKQKKSGGNIICKNLKHYQATSGSSSKVKWIPYNKSFVADLDRAYNIWIQDLYRRYPNIKTGQHYWSMSWVPNDMRAEVKTNDANLFRPFKQFLLNQIFPVPDDVAHTESIEESMYLTAKYLVQAEDLSLISVWSPTFFISILELILEKRKDIRFNITNERQKMILKNLTSLEDIHKLWPNLALISAWDTANSKLYAKKLQNYFPHVPFQGKGLWATEGVVTIPFEENYYLAYQSHFYEFENLKSGQIIPSWKLRKGDEVAPIITSANGLVRYKINDRLLVNDFDQGCPMMTFLGRDDGADMVGEKLSVHDASGVVQVFGGFCLVGVQMPNSGVLPYYTFVCESDREIDPKAVEAELKKSYHYNLARDLGQLGEVRIYKHPNPMQLYQELCRDKGMISGNIKMEVVTTIETDTVFNEK